MDRWLEIDIDWFGPPPCGDRIEEFAQRVEPLWRGASGYHGIILNIGWLVDIITEWTGDPGQALPLRSRRYQRWAQTSYQDLADFVSQLRYVVQSHGARDLRIGVMVAGLGEVVAPRATGAMYDLFSNWYDRHPELYPLDISDLPGPDLDPRVPLAADDYRYATRPRGLTGGERFADVLAGQWGAVSRFVQFDAIHLRDGFVGPLLYSRRGPYGTVPSADPQENETWTDEVVHLVRSVKDARPEALVLLYSSGVSNTAEWRAGCVDIHRIVEDGALDIWIDQTWGGAWQDWWDDWWKGWTYQLANLLGHGVSLRDANRSRPGENPCRHYKLIETWDGWEPWDTLHRTPGKLEWGIWAFSHASVLTDSGLQVPEGSYISWMSDWTLDLLSEQDIAFLAEHLDRAEASAGQIREALGPIAVFDRQTVAKVHATTPQANCSEWIEDHVAMLLKWGTPILAAAEWQNVPADTPEGLVVQLAGALPAPVRDRLGDGEFGPIVAVGRADWVDPSLLRVAGVAAVGEIRPAGYRRDEPSSLDLLPGDSVHLPDHQPVDVEPGVRVVYRADGVTLIAGRDGTWYWQPPDLVDPGNPLMPRSQLGTIAPYVEMSRLLAGESRGVRTAAPDVRFPVTVQCWHTGEAALVLVGNLESGWVGDSRTARQVTVEVPRSRLPFDVTTAAVANGEHPDRTLQWRDDGRTIALTIGVPPSGCTVIELSAGRQ